MKMENSFKKYNQTGISLLEVLLSLSIIAIILIMATRYFFVASNNNKINTTISQVSALVAAAHSYKGVQADYDANLLIATLADHGQLTNFPGYDSSNETLMTLWATPISIAASSGDSKKAEIKVTLPDTQKCKALERAFISSESDSIITSKCAGTTFSYTFP